jgi:hypothetical protein
MRLSKCCAVLESSTISARLGFMLSPAVFSALPLYFLRGATALPAGKASALPLRDRLLH